jgi:hypothetical protein
MNLKFLFIALVAWGTLAGQWEPSSSLNTSLTVIAKTQDNLHAVSDANGGSVISWDDNRNSSSNSTDIYAHRINKSGIIKWAANGIAICSYTAAQKASAIADVGQGNSIIVWEDHRNGNADIYAQKIDSSGNILWTANGIAVCSKALHQKNPKAVSDNAGGAIIVWEDSLNNFWDIYAQRITSSGSIAWAASGISICAASNTQLNPKIETDAAGGAIIVWQDKRSNVDYDIYAQRVNANGVVQWTVDGVAITLATNTQSNPRIEPDGNGGAVIGWTDKRNATDNNIYAQCINSVGITQWATGGNSVCVAAGSQSALDIKYLGSTGILFTWKDARTATLSIYAQLLAPGGLGQLTTNGVLISNGSFKANNPNVISDKQNGCIIAWQDSSSTGWNIRSQRLDASGAVLWQSGGVTVSDATDDQINVVQVADNTGGASYFWEDHRNGTDYDIFAHHLNNTGDVGIREIRADKNNAVICYPNPIDHSSVIKLTDNTQAKTWELQIVDQLGRTLVKQTLNCTEDYILNAATFKAGIYYYNVNVNGTSAKGSFISTYSDN